MEASFTMATPYAYFQKRIVPLPEAKVGIMTHAFNYGTAVFEGIRGNWNADDETIYLFKVPEHLKRLRQSARIIRIEISETNAELTELVKQVVSRSNIREDQYVRPLAYKSSEVLGVRVHNLDDDVVIVRDNRLITPEKSDNVLEGITLETVLFLARTELGLEVVERTIDRSELYVADEVFLTGTAAHVTPA